MSFESIDHEGIEESDKAGEAGGSANGNEARWRLAVEPHDERLTPAPPWGLILVFAFLVAGIAAAGMYVCGQLQKMGVV